MPVNRCTFKCGDWNCGSYQFNLYKADIDQGDLCDVHYWQTKAQREWVGLTDEEIDDIYWRNENLIEHQVPIWPYERAIEQALKEKNT
jgi:hypothetical protein